MKEAGRGGVGGGVDELPRSAGERRALARIQLFRQLSGWGTVVWFPLVLVLISTGRATVAVALAIAGGVFSGLLRLAVALASCPRCGERYLDMEKGFHGIWQHDRCEGCGLRRYAS